MTDAWRDLAGDYIGKKQAGKPYFLKFALKRRSRSVQPAAPKKYMDRFPDIKDEKHKEFAGEMMALDDAVGAVFQKVCDMGQEENTPIIFYSDNGCPTWKTTASKLPLHGSKGTTSEGCTCIPFCMK